MIDRTIEPVFKVQMPMIFQQNKIIAEENYNISVNQRMTDCVC